MKLFRPPGASGEPPWNLLVAGFSLPETSQKQIVSLVSGTYVYIIIMIILIIIIIIIMIMIIIIIQIGVIRGNTKPNN